MSGVMIKELPSEERPRERLQRYGAHALSTQELLAIVLRTGTGGRSAIDLAEELLKDHKDIRGIACASVEQLAKIKGIGPVKGIQIAACIELGRRLQEMRADRREIKSPQDAVDLLMPRLRDADKELFYGILLDSRARIIREVEISKGSLNNSIVHPREVFKAAITASAESIIVAHNHPSGDPTPSPEDRRVTARLQEAGKLMGIELVDHLIIGDGRWVSLKECGFL